ncbi:zinc finger protein ZAT11-like [Solanum dulcamara]|uniref:zinc finger protein ZAT11-like n=1 Tax=Solanum dulcamara TaxID=45834 RepID=UPI002485F9A5|nr:zinc finger protein ZAT11-like [Solanum dulcamara]
MGLTWKRSRLEEESVEKFVMASCVDIMKRNESLGPLKLFECKTCKKKFDSLQALGGHKASHKSWANRFMLMSTNGNSYKLKKHKCSICGDEFAIAQALGGHMGKYHNKLNQLDQKKKKLKENSKSGESVDAFPEKKSKCSGRTLFWDLNLTPSENELMTGISF